MVIGAARFAVQHVDEVEDVPVESWVYPQDRDIGFFDYALAERILDFFDGHIGPFPYEKLANVQSKTRYGGMENASNIFYSENSVTGTRQSEGLLAHEIAHQWFGDSVTEQDWPHIWLSEGFATYFTQLYFEFTYGRDRMNAEMQNDRQQIVNFASQNPQTVVVPSDVTDPNRLLNTYSYQKGGWILHMLRFVVGDAAFWEGIQAYYRTYRDANASSADFQQVIEDAAGRNLDGFFQQWLYQPGQPHLEGGWRYDAAQQQLVITLNQTQAGDAFRLPLEVGIFTDDAALPHIEVLDVDHREHTFTINLDTAPNRVVLDPNTWLLMTADFEAR
jgi:aminopeptidase N